MSARTGDRPNYQLTNQRFDKGDAYRLNTLIEETITRATGGAFGQTWGCLSTPDATLRVLAGPPAEVYLDIGACLLLRSAPDGFVNTIDVDIGPYDGKVVIHDPARSAQASSAIDVTAFAPTSYGGGGGGSGSRCWLVFRRQESVSELDDKAFWDAGAGVESTAPTNLIVQEYVEFAAVATIPNANSTYGMNNGWFRFAYIADWANPAGPTVVPIHWIHAPYLQQTTPPAYPGSQFALAPNSLTSVDAGGTRGFAPDLGMPSVAKILHWMLAKLSQHYSTNSIVDFGQGVFSQFESGDGWMATPPRGLVEVDAALTQAATDITAADAAITSLTATVAQLSASAGFLPRVLQVVRYTQSSGTYVAALSSAEAGITVTPGTPSAGGQHRFTVSGAGAHTLHAVTGQANVVLFLGSGDIPLTVSVLPLEGLPVEFATNPSTDVELAIVTPAGTHTDVDCTFFFYGRRS
jgi:hypothetical protein